MMTPIRFGLIFVSVLVVEGYYYNEYFPQQRSFNSRKGDDLDSAPVVVNEVTRPDRWTRLKQRSQDILRNLRARRQRAQSASYRQQTRYNDYVYRSPRTNIYPQQSSWQWRTWYSRDPARRYVKGNNRNPGNSVQGYDRNLGNSVEPYKHSGTYVKGPQTVSRDRDDEYRPKTGSEYVYPKERVEVTTDRYVDARPDYTNGQGRTRRTNLKRKRNNRKTSSSDYTQSTRKRNNRRATTTPTTPTTPTTQSIQSRRASEGYAGCRDTGMYCEYWKSIGCCDQPLGERYCAKTCGLCSPQQTICPSSYKFGCCWNGDEALDYEKKGCKTCADVNTSYCHNPVIYKDCDLHRKDALKTRRICPVTCGACDDFSSILAL